MLLLLLPEEVILKVKVALFIVQTFLMMDFGGGKNQYLLQPQEAQDGEHKRSGRYTSYNQPK